jgi:hypothetical protein
MTQLNQHPMPHTIDESLDQAFSTYPLEAAPPNFSAGVLGRLKALPTTTRPRFRLSWFDWAISLFTTGMAGVGYVVWQTLPPQAVAQLQITWLIWFQHVAQLLPH